MAKLQKVVSAYFYKLYIKTSKWILTSDKTSQNLKGLN